MSLGICTLQNLGNTCYINSIIQILLHTYELNNVLLQTTKVKNTLENIVVYNWTELLNQTIRSKHVCKIAPHNLIRSISNYNPRWNNQSQHDAGEFIVDLIDIFNKSLSRQVHIQLVNKTNDQIYIECYKRLTQLYSNDYSDLISIFNGMIITEITDLHNNNISRTFDPYSILEVPIADGINHTSTIYDCLNLLWCAEQHSDYKVTRELHEFKMIVNKTYYLWMTPQILFIHLKRHNNPTIKSNTYVDIPHNLDLSKYLYNNCTANPHYKLYAICNHTGDAYNGHYYSYVFIPKINKWLLFNDDSNPVIIPENQVSTPNAVCVCYRQLR